ncbi:MAG: hypothetical protein NVS3B7_11220 [Candidatus Elarobacter sp.]
MIDPLGDVLRAAALGSPLAYPLAFAAGALTSAGPCVAPRYVAVTALANASARPWRIIATFVAGVLGAYVVLGLAAGSLGTLWSSSPWLYASLAVVLAAGGIRTLVCGPRDGHVCLPARSLEGAGGTFLIGASSALVVSPCCTPVIAALAGLTLTAGRTLEGVLLLVAFGCGHALPLVAAGAVGARLGAMLGRLTSSAAPSTVGGSLMLALAAYYGALA